MTTLADYEAWKANQAKASVGAAQVVIGSIDAGPDEVAGDMNLATEFAKTTGNPQPPAQMVPEYRNVFQAAIEKKRSETILTSSPRLTEWLRNPDNAAVARDDLEGLSWFETAFTAAGNAASRGFRRVPQSYNQWRAIENSQRDQDAGRTLGEIVYDERIPIIGPDGQELGRLWAGPVAAVSSIWRYGASRLDGDAEAEAVEYQMRAGEISNNIAAIPMSPAGERFKGEFAKITGSGDVWADLGQFATAVGNDPGGFTAFLAEVAVESMPMMAASIGAGLVTRNPATAAATMGLTSGAQEYGTAPAEFFNEKGIDVSTPEGALKVVTDPLLMREAEARGITRGVIIGALDGLSGGIAGVALAKSPMANLALQSVVQAVMGGGGEGLAQVAAGQEFNIAEVLVEALAEFVTAPIEVTGMAGAEILKNQRSAKSAAQRVAVFEALSGQAQSSKLRARMPERFRQFVDRATADGPVENVYIPADQFVTYFQGQGVDPFEMLSGLEGVTEEDLRDALNNGTDLKIPTSTYAASMAGSDADGFLMQNMRFDPNEMTAAEAQAFNEKAADAMAEAWEAAEAVRLEDEQWRGAEAKIYDDMVSRLRIAGRSTDVATSEAMIYPAFYRVMAERSGLTTDEFLARYPLPQVRGSIPEGLAPKNVDDLSRTLAAARSRKAPTADRRQSLLEFIDGYGGINDLGGELDAMDAATIKRGRGKKTLRLKRDTSGAGQGSMFGSAGGKAFGPDDVAQAAIEAGFMADNPEVIAYKAAMESGEQVPDITQSLWDAIAAEVRGEAQFSDQDTAPEDDSYLDDIENYLSQLGLSLDDDDATIRDAITAARDEDARMYGQDGALKTDSAEFKAWFGDSKVVGPDGAPLVVYHGTNQQIDEFDLTRGGASTGSNAGATKAFFFTDNLDVAGQYAEHAGKRVVANVAAYELESQRLQKEVDRLERAANRTGDWSAYERAMELWEAHEAGALYADDAEGQNVVEVYLSIQNPMVVEFEGGRLSQDRDLDSLIEQAKADGRDGLILRGLEDSPQMGVVSDQFVAFSPAQIKSVSNRGTFDANDPRILYQFAGPRAKSADADAMDRAVIALADGSSPDAVRDETGWFVAPDGNLKFEISDAGAALSADASDLIGGAPEFIEYARDGMLNASSGVRLTDILSHDEIYGAYPFLKSVDIVKATSAIRDDGKVVALSADGSAMQQFITINPVWWNHDRVTDSDRRSAIIHEIQHLIQYKEGWSNGARSFGNAEGYKRNFGEIEARATQNRSKIPSDGLGIIPISYDVASGDMIFPETPNAVKMSDELIEAARGRIAASEALASKEIAAAEIDRLSSIISNYADDISAAAMLDKMYSLAESPQNMAGTIAAAWVNDREFFAEDFGKNLEAAIEKIAGVRSYNQADGMPGRPLYVVHNLSAENLRRAAAIGGLAAPSLAVARGDLSFDSFGEISLIGDPSMADPKSKGVRLFKADIYSPRQPRERFIVKASDARKVWDVLNSVRDDFGIDSRKGLEDLEREGLGSLKADIAVKAAWLKSIGDDVPLVRRAPEPAPVPIFGYDAFTAVDAKPLYDSPEFIAHVQKVKDDFLASRVASGVEPEMLDRIKARLFDENGVVTDDIVVDTAIAVSRRNREIAGYDPDAPRDLDQYETAKAVDAAISGREGVFNDWVNDTFSGVVGKSFFENEAGRKRDYTIENLVREMTRTIRNGENWNYGAGNVRAAVAPEFKSLKAVKDARGQIGAPDAMGKLKDEMNAEIFALADKFAPYHSSGDSFGWRDTFSEFLKDIAKGPRYLNEWQSSVFSEPVPGALISEAVAFLEKLKTLPTEYFEIKMQRAVGFDEFTAAVIPGNLSADSRKILTDAGLDLIEYTPGEDGSRKAAVQSIGDRVFFQRNETGPRGQISIDGQGAAVISLFERADLSTMLHESGHFFLTIMQDLASKGEGQSVADYEAVKGWWRDNAKAVAADGLRAMPDTGITEEDVKRALDFGTTGDVLKDAAVDVGMQEQWARAFEAYLMEGKAPSVELRGAFEKFRSWLVSIYKRLSGLNVEMSADIRNVFDRMLASDDEIAQAKIETGDMGPAFASAEAMGLTQDEYEAFMRLRSDAESESHARMLAEAMAPIKRERDEWFKKEKAAAREEVEREINLQPVYRAYEWMGNGRWLGGDEPENMPKLKLSKEILVDRYGDGVLKTLSDGRKPVYSVEGGADPDDVAGWFGFSSGDQMVKAIEGAPKRTAAIDAETDRVMYERHGDVLRDGTAEAAALDAVHVDKKGQWLARELKAVSDVAGRDVSLTSKEARASARDTISRMKTRDAVNAGRFLAAERKAGQEAARLGAMLAREGVWMGNARRRVATKAKAALRGAGTADAVAMQIDRANSSTKNYNETVDRFIAAKRRQLLNHALYMESRKAAEEVGKAERYITKLNKASNREKIAGAGRREGAQIDYLAAIDELQGRYDFRRMSGSAEQRRGALAAYVEAMTAAGRENELSIPDAVIASAAKAPYKTLPMDELRGVIDSLKNLEHTAKRWNDLIDAKGKRKLDEAADAIVEAFDANVEKRPPGRVKTRAEALRHGARQYIDLVLNATTMLREIDGFKDGGAAYENIKRPIDDAMDRLIVRKETAAEDLDKIYAVYSKDERRRMAVREHMPALGYAMSKWDRIAVALNTGNEGNFFRLTDKNTRGALTEAQVAAVLETLDERDADFIQSVWDYIGSFRDDIAARERRVTGTEPAWVDASPVTIGGKELAGGYYPLKYDPRLSSLARDDEAQELAKSLQSGRFGKAQTKNGHLKERAKSSGRDVELDMSVLHRHVNQVIYDLELSEAVTNSYRVLKDGRVRQSFMDAGKQADFDALEIWLKDVAEGQVNSGDWMSKAARTMKSNFTAAKLAFNLSTVAVQITGLSQTMVVVGKKDFAVGVQQSFRPGVIDEIAAKSAFMRSRQTTFNKDIYDYYADPTMGPAASRWGQIKQDLIGPLSFWLMTKVQWHLVDVPTWMAGYHQGLRQFGNDEAKAIAHADDIVKRAQASGLFSDRSAIERGSIGATSRQNDVVRLFTTLGSYMFAKFNVAYERSAVAGREIRNEGASMASAAAALSWSLDMAFLFTFEAVIIGVIKGRLPGDDDDEDGDGVADEWAKYLAKETAFGVMGTMPFIRDIASTMGGFEGGGAYGAITKEAAAPFVQIVQGDIDRGTIKSIINATGLMTGLPSTQVNRAVDAAWRQAEGEDVSPLEYLLGKIGR